MVPVLRLCLDALARRLALFVLLLLPALTAAQQQAAEYELKAAFLYNFATYVDWPPEVFAQADAPFVFGVLGPDELADYLERIVDERLVRDRRVEIRRLENERDLNGVQVLFIGSGQQARAAPLLEQALASRVLTVTEERALPPNAAINFSIEEGKVRFDVNLPVAQRAGLTISSRLLGVARQVLSQAP